MASQSPLSDSQQPASDAETAGATAAHDAAVLAEARRRSRRAFLKTGLVALAGVGGWRWLVTRPQEQGMPWTLRRILDANQRVAAAYFRETRLAPEFARSKAKMPRVNGPFGMSAGFDPAAWTLRVRDYASGQLHQFSIDDIRALPRVEMTTEFKCVEGWSTIVHWGGARLSDFLARHPLAMKTAEGDALAPFISFRTPDDAYYVGLDMASALHPQTLLCYEMDGKPLTVPHGAPLRLVTPLKYGIKQIKRIGTIAFHDVRPADYWAERGYDWDAGH